MRRVDEEMCRATFRTRTQASAWIAVSAYEMRYLLRTLRLRARHKAKENNALDEDSFPSSARVATLERVCQEVHHAVQAVVVGAEVVSH